MGVVSFNEAKATKKNSVQEEKKLFENIEDVKTGIESIQNADQTIEAEKPVIEEFSGYKLYRDKQENFCCEVMIEGANYNSSKVRLIIESPEWNLFFNGTMEPGGKCIIPIKKLPILSEGTKGTIKLEVIAEDTVFVPWEEEFMVKSSNKVLVKVMEQEKHEKLNVKVRI